MSQTPIQRSLAVDLNDLPPCVDCAHVDHVMISGYDDKMRCGPCNMKHLDEVDTELAQASVLPPKTVSPELNTRARREEFRAKILAKNAPRDGFSTPPQTPLGPGDSAHMTQGSGGLMGISNPLETKEEKRARIVMEIKKSMGLK